MYQLYNKRHQTSIRTIPMEPEEHVLEIMHDLGINVVLTLPCDRIKALLSMAESEFFTIPLTREENGIGICAGAYMAGARPLMMIQSTGLGNMINAIASLNQVYDLPLPIIASWRGVYKEGIAAQIPFGEHLPGILKGAGIEYTIIEDASEIDKVGDVIRDAFENEHTHVALMSPKVWEDSTCTPLSISCGPQKRTTDVHYIATIPEPIMTRYDAIVATVSAVSSDGLGKRDDKGGDYDKDNCKDVIISNIGAPCKELYAAKDRDANFYMMGSLGLASAIGLGMALFSKRRVYVLDGDGSILMNPSALLETAVQKPVNLTIICLDNSSYGSTGDQLTCTGSVVDLELFAKACGIKNTTKVHTQEGLVQAIGAGYTFIHTIIKPGNRACMNIPLSAKEIKVRFMKQMLGKEMKYS